MTDLALVSFGLLLTLALAQGIYVIVFTHAITTELDAAKSAGEYPAAAVVLCLRGSDPFLSDCLTALMELDYPDYAIWIIVDNDADPAMDVVRKVLPRTPHPRCHLRVLDSPPSNCSLKCASLVDAVQAIDPHRGMIALLDADSVPHPNWLRELASGLAADARHGAVSGLRWYMPEDQHLGSLIRYIWNSAAIVQMYWYGIAWGGSLAFRRDAMDQSQLVDRWQRAFCEDTMVSLQMRRHGRKLAVVPSLLMVNRESCTVHGFFDWVQRQLLTVRLYHPAWWLVVGHALATTIANLMAVIIGVNAYVQNRPTAAAWAAGGFLVFQAANLLWLTLLERAARQPLHRRREPIAWLTIGKLTRLMLAVPAAQIIHFAAVVATLLRRNVTWRGVRYRVDGPWAIVRQSHPPSESMPGRWQRTTDSL